MVTSQFVHERVHNEFDEIGGTSPEAVSQGIQFLYDPGNNYYFERDLYNNSILRANNILRRTAKTNHCNEYEIGNIVWAIDIYEEMNKLYPERFIPLTSSPEKNLSMLIQLPSLLKSMRKDIGNEEWKKLQKHLMKSLLEYDSEQQGKIIVDFPQKASRYGLDFVINPDQNYQQAA